MLYMAKQAYDAGKLPLGVRRRVEQFATQLDDFLFEPDEASLIHGDMWGGNVLAKDGKIAGFIDPAIYYAHAEIELAFSTLFSTFGDAFFAVYNNLRPIEPDFFEVRRDIYNLYPLLVHVRLFGGGYVSQVSSIVSRLGF
ncbi:MAG: fructosamine kinase family protein [Chloroflexota bacterium]